MSFPYLHGSSFGRIESAEAPRHAIFGVPLDLAVTNRPGARLGPGAIRRASWMLTDGGHPHWGRDPFARTDLADLGDIVPVIGDAPACWARVKEQARMILAGGARPIALGGDHSLTLPILEAVAELHGTDYALIHFDAHVDTWPAAEGRWHHGSPFRQAIEGGVLAGRHYIQLGIRSPVPPDLMDWQRRQGITTLSAIDIHSQPLPDTLAAIRAVTGDRPVYLSLDIDALDPAQAPGTGTPEIGGLFSWQIQVLLRGLNGLDFIGMDMVEVAPPFDVAEITALAAASFVYEYLAIAP